MAEVKIEVTAVDKTGGVLDKLSNASGKLTGQTTALNTATSQTAASSGKASAQVQNLATAGGAAAVASGRLKGALGQAMPMLMKVAGPLAAAYGLKRMSDVAEDFQAEMASVSTLVTRTDGEMKAWGRNLAEMAPGVGRRTKDLAGGLYQVISAIGDVGGKMDVLEVSAKAATAGLTDTYTAVDIITTGLNAYGLEASEAATISDKLFTAVRLGKTTFPELAGSMGQVLPFASQLNVSFGETAAALAALTSAGLSTDIATTALRSTFVSFIQNAENFKAAGVDILKVVSEEGLAGGLTALKEITGGNIEMMREFIPETRALAAVLTLTGENAGKFTVAQEEMRRAVGATDAAFEKQANTLSFAKAQFAATFDALAIGAGETFLPGITGIVKGLTWAIDKFHAFGVAIGEGAAIWYGWRNAAVGALEQVNSRIDYTIGKLGALGDAMRASMAITAPQTGGEAARSVGMGPLGALMPAMEHIANFLLPEMHSGGVIPRYHSGGALASDERLIIGQTGEGVVSRDGMEALSRINSGRVGGVTLKFGDILIGDTGGKDGRQLAREWQEQVADDIETGRSPIMTALNKRFAPA